MPDQPIVSPKDQRKRRDAARDGDRARRAAIEKAMQAGWAGHDADESNLLAEAMRAHPGPDAAVRTLYGAVTRLVERVADATGKDRDQVLRDALRL